MIALQVIFVACVINELIYTKITHLIRKYFHQLASSMKTTSITEDLHILRMLQVEKTESEI